MAFPAEKFSQLPTQASDEQAAAAEEAYRELAKEKIETAETGVYPAIGTAKTEVARGAIMEKKKKAKAGRDTVVERIGAKNKETAASKSNEFEDADRTEITSRAHYNKVLAEVTFDLFAKALNEGMLATCAGHLERAFKMNLPEYHKMKQEYIDNLEKNLAKPDISAEHRLEIQVLKFNAESDSFDFINGPDIISAAKGVSEKEMHDFSKKMKTTEIKAIPELFERQLAHDDIGGAYRQLAKAFKYKDKLEPDQYDELKSLFILACETRLALPDDKVNVLARKSLEKMITDIENDIYD
ncbi:MAG: hypothetical protein ACOZBH_00535 [Patescibacteria group bacterium]